MKCILFLLVLGLDVSVVLDKQVDQLHILRQDCVVQSAVACLGLLVIDIDRHICCKVLIDESGDGIIVSLLSGIDEILALFEIGFPPGPPYFLICVL